MVTIVTFLTLHVDYPANCRLLLSVGYVLMRRSPLLWGLFTFISLQKQLQNLNNLSLFQQDANHQTNNTVKYGAEVYENGYGSHDPPHQSNPGSTAYGVHDAR